MTKQQAQAILDAKAVLRKIRAAKGRLQGNFYWAGSSSCESVGLVVTLSRRDADGGKALRQGKPLRAEIKGSKFGRGLVKMIDGKLIFELYGGSANKVLIMRSFKQNLSKLENLAYLNQAIVVSPEVDSKEEIRAAISQAEDVEVAQLTISDLVDIKQQHELVDLNDTLQKAFLAQNDIQSEKEEAIRESLEDLKVLRDAGKDDEVKMVRVALAEMLSTGDDPFPDAGGQMSREECELLFGALEEANHLLMQRMAQSAKRIEQIYDFTVSADKQALAEQASQLLQELVPLREAYEADVQQLQENMLS